MYHKIYHTNNNSNDCLGETSVSRYDVSLISKDCASLAIKIFQELHHWWRSHFFQQMKVICKGDFEKSLRKRIVKRILSFKRGHLHLWFSPFKVWYSHFHAHTNGIKYTFFLIDKPQKEVLFYKREWRGTIPVYTSQLSPNLKSTIALKSNW